MVVLLSHAFKSCALLSGQLLDMHLYKKAKNSCQHCIAVHAYGTGGYAGVGHALIRENIFDIYR